MSTPFTSRQQVIAYLEGDTIECLECGKKFKSLGSHLHRIHQTGGREYKIKWGIPQSASLVTARLRHAQSDLIKILAADGRLNRDPLAASAAARFSSTRWPRTDYLTHEQRTIARKIQHATLPTGAKRIDGRDADRARAYQREYRKLKRATPSQTTN